LNVWSCAGLAALLAPEPMVLYMMQPAGTFQPLAKRAVASLVGRLAWVPVHVRLVDSQKQGCWRQPASQKTCSEGGPCVEGASKRATTSPSRT
jgi:hypothetical protein